MGQVIDNRYKIIKKIGEGGMGAVYLAEDTRLERQVAVKRLQLLGKRADLEMFQKRFEREAKEMARFQHTGIVSVYDYGQDEEGIYLVLEYMPGGSLIDRMKNGLIPVEEAIEIIVPLAKALQVIHDLGRVHRDIKPSNILFDAYGVPKLADFGIVKLVEGEEGHTLTATGAVIGTPSYMAPETVDGEAFPATDQYALGIVLYEMVTGRQPFRGPTPMATLYKQKNDPLPDPLDINPDLPEWICAVLKTSLEKDAGDRFPDVTQFADVLEKQEFDDDQTNYVPIIQGDSTILPPGVQHPDDEPTAIDEPTAVNESQPTAQVTELGPYSPAVQAPQDRGKKKFPAWLPWVGVLGALILVAAVVIIVLLSRLSGTGQAEPTQMAEDVIATEEPTFTKVAEPSANAEEVRLDFTMTPTTQPSSTDVPTNEPTPTTQPTNTSTLTITPTSTVEFRIGSTMVREKDGMVMMFVPEGSFSMGDDNYDDERPVHQVSIDAYWIDKYEVTNQQFQSFISATGYVTSADSLGSANVFSNGGWSTAQGANWQHPRGTSSSISGLENHPVVQVSWWDARKYCEYVGGRLPTEAEWEKAARGMQDQRIHPWGNSDADSEYANFADVNLDVSWADNNENDGFQYTSPVGFFPSGDSPFGVSDMAGNVLEWVSDWFNETYYSVSPMKNPEGPSTGSYRVVKGDSWLYVSTNLRLTSRIGLEPDYSNNNIGFRCVYDVEP